VRAGEVGPLLDRPDGVEDTANRARAETLAGIHADLALVKAWKGDRTGNLLFRKTARNFNPMVATCGQVTIAEVEELLEPGELEPDQIHTSGIFVDRIIQTDSEKRIENRTIKE
jgi:acyl CoA:acetate/3-ketoacid CoA transferase alpha subunit